MGAPWLAKRRGVFSLVVHIRVIWSFQGGTRDVAEGMPSYSPHLAKNNKHVRESLGCRMQVEGHGRGLRRLGVKEVILEGLLIGQDLDFIIGHISPVIYTS